MLEDHGLLVEEVEGAGAGVESNGFIRMKSIGMLPRVRRERILSMTEDEARTKVRIQRLQTRVRSWRALRRTGSMTMRSTRVEIKVESKKRLR